MNAAVSTQNLAISFFLLLVLTSCKQPETVIVDRNPTTKAPADTTDTLPNYAEKDFRQLTVGVNENIHSLDPLLASNTTELRAAQLIYEGLVRFDESGEIIPAIAQKWEIQNNHQEFTFHLRTDIFYHDSDIFGSGKGRKLVADDIKFVFERMANNNVPPRAALLFMDIEGMNDYYQEQRHVYNSALRQISGISGITVPSDSTVVFRLNHPDRDFLKKLATPRAVIYPKEAVGNDVESFKPVGSGPYAFSQSPNDTTLIFSTFNDYHHSTESNLDRVDFVSSESEMALWDGLKSGSIQYIPEIGPQLADSVLSSNGTLKPALTSSFSLSEPVPTTLTVHQFFDGGTTVASGAALTRLAQKDSLALFHGMGPTVHNASFSTDELQSSSQTKLSLQSVKTEDPYGEQLIKNLQKLLSNNGGSLKIRAVRVPTHKINLFVTERGSLLSNSIWSGSPSLFSLNLSLHGISTKRLSGIAHPQYSWWFDLRQAQISKSDQN